MSRALVNAMDLSTIKHPKPYKIGCIKKGSKTKANEICTIPLSNGKCYQDEMTCDVIEIDACHILLRPWQFDKDTIHKEKITPIPLWKNKNKGSTSAPTKKI